MFKRQFDETKKHSLVVSNFIIDVKKAFNMYKFKDNAN